MSILHKLATFTSLKIYSIPGMLNKKIIFLLPLILICICATGQLTQSGKSGFNSIVSELEAELQKDITDDTLAGSISIAIVHKNQIIWSKAFGYADKDNKTPADTSTIYRIASLTKSFTAMAMMQLVEKGVLKLSDPVESYLPEIKNLKGYHEANKITFFQLATHTSGLEREPHLENASKGTIQTWESKVLECIPTTSVKTTPGKKYNYSNIGYAILGLALERAAKKPYMTLITDNIFAPLQMDNSFFIVPSDKMGKLAKGLVINSSGRLTLESSSSAYGYGLPAGGIYSTPDDLLKFVMANMGFPPLCNVDNRELMQKGVKPPLPFLKMSGIRVLSIFLFGEPKKIVRIALHSKYGIGLSVCRYKDMYIIEHSGLVPGYSSKFSFDKKSQYGVAVLRNYTSGKTNLDLLSIDLLSKLKSLKD